LFSWYEEISISKRLEHFLDKFPMDCIPSLDQQGLTAYLCCLNSLLAPIDPRVTAELDKRSVF
jgi:hypothetical protein